MVDALRSAWRVLRPGGFVADMQPAAVYRPRLAIVQGSERRDIGAMTSSREPSVDAAHDARRRAVAEGWFTLVTSTHGSYGSRYRGLADLPWILWANPNWHIEPSLRRRLEAAWARRPPGAMIELRRSYSLAVLRRRAKRDRA